MQSFSRTTANGAWVVSLMAAVIEEDRYCGVKISVTYLHQLKSMKAGT
jgi:hypothetical protein